MSVNSTVAVADPANSRNALKPGSDGSMPTGADTGLAGFAITPANTDMAVPCRGIYVGVTGDIKVDMVGGGTVTFVGVPQGTILPARCKRVYLTGTTASSLVGLT